MNNYSYPLDDSWTKEEIIIVVELLSTVERAYEAKVNKDEFLQRYKAFKKVVTSMSEEKRITKEFEQQSGYSLYRLVQKIKNSDQKFITMV